MADEQELFEEARRSRADTDELREESGLGSDATPEPPPPESPLPHKDDPQPWAKTSSGNVDSVTDDD
jgi:hypothetical protein